MPTFLAMITTIEGGLGPSHPIAPGGPPLGIWGGAPPPYVDIGGPGSQPHPSHPIAPGGRPPGIWGGAPTYPDIGFPGPQPTPTPPIYYPPSGGGGHPPPLYPTHPIAPGGRPPGIWGGAPTYPDIGGPGPQPTPTPPIYLPPGTLPGHPEHPIYIPPSVGIPGFPTHPIVVPPAPEKPQVLENWDVKAAWSPQSGWVVAIVPSEEHPGVPTPS
jgi:hypothetical protein